MNYIISGIIGIAIAVAGFFGMQQSVPSSVPLSGNFNPSGGGTYRLGQSIGTADVTIKLSSFTEPVSGIKYTMTYLNASVGYGTLSPQSSISEFISFTGITQNSDGSALLTGVVRGLSRSPAGTASNCTTASTTLAQGHAGQSIFILSNSPCFQAEYAVKQNMEYITGAWGFQGTAPTSTICANGSELCNKNYVDSVALQGAATSTETNGGIVELATAAEQASSFNGGSAKPTVLQSKYSTSTCQVVQSSNIVASTTTGRLDKGCFDQTANYNFTGSTTLATSTQATTTITSLTISSSTINFNGRLAPSPLFGGTGTDGALSISSGTTTVALGTASVYEKDYTSISITGTGALNFSSAATSTAGVVVILRSQGACTLTSSSFTMIDMRWLGGGIGTGLNGRPDSNGNAQYGGGGGGGGGSSDIGGAGNPAQAGTGGQGGVSLFGLATSSRQILPGGRGGNGATGTGGAGASGGLGGGGLYIECAGALNFTTGGIRSSGANGLNGAAGNGTTGDGGGGGGGAGGNVLIFYSSLTANTGTVNVTSGSGGTSGAGGGPTGGSGGAGAAGSHLEAQNTYFY